VIAIDPINPLRLPAKINEKVKSRHEKTKTKNRGTAAKVSGSIK
jgi:hypothetical protein